MFDRFDFEIHQIHGKIQNLKIMYKSVLSNTNN